MVRLDLGWDGKGRWKVSMDVEEEEKTEGELVVGSGRGTGSTWLSHVPPYKWIRFAEMTECRRYSDERSNLVIHDCFREYRYGKEEILFGCSIEDEMKNCDRLRFVWPSVDDGGGAETLPSRP